MNALSLFAGGGIGETFLHDIGIKTVVANELLSERAKIHQFRFPDTNMIAGDIKKKKEEIIQMSKDNDVKLLIATPPCQGMSQLGQRRYHEDERNYLIFDVLDIIDNVDFDYIFIENVPQFLNMYYPFKGDVLKIEEILEKKYLDKYNIIAGVYNAADYGVPQRRKRTIIRMYKKHLSWNDPAKVNHYITLREAIGHLPSIESGESSGIKYHDGPKCSPRHIEFLKHTPSGCSAHDNPIHYPKKENGDRIKGYHNTYKRLDWDTICSTRTMNSHSVSGSNNCHPGKLLPDGTYSDARTLSLLELLIVSSLPEDIQFPDWVTEKMIREIIGEGVPPLMSKAFLKEII
jgi:DNA (cytosine-5)-methyltransferase 1